MPAALETARDRSALEQVGSQAFHMEAQFESTSDTGVVSRGTFTEDWWNELWWRQVTVVNGLRREVVQVAGKPLRDEDDGFVLPLRVQALLLAVRRPFPERPQLAGQESSVRLEHSALHCVTLPTAAEAPDLKPAPKTFCVDEPGDLRMTADPVYRVLYDDIVQIGSHQAARSVLMLAGTEKVASLHIQRCTLLAGGPEELQQMSMDDQIRFALANPRTTMLLHPALMQRQMISTDVRLMPQGGMALRPNQRFAVVRLVEADGKLLDAEVMGASDDGTRVLAVRILRNASFRVPTRQERSYAYEGTVVLASPLGR